jgi:DNA-binding transcriptional LysR family regulator
MMLNLRHLRVFAAVAERGGFSRAAAALRLSQPAISKAVRELERQIGLPLIDRSGRTPRLTDAGTALYARARELFGVERMAEETLRALRGLEDGRLRIAASTTIATYFLPPLLARFHRAHPRVALQVTSANTRAVAKLLLERRVDVALVEGPVVHSRITVHEWREDALGLIAAAGHPLAAQAAGGGKGGKGNGPHLGDAGKVPLDALRQRLRDEPLVMREEGSGTRAVVQAALQARGLEPRHTIELGSTEAIKQAVAAGLGLAIVSRASAADQLALGRIAGIEVTDLDVRRPLSRLRLRGAAPSAAAAAFEQMLLASARAGRS